VGNLTLRGKITIFAVTLLLLMGCSIAATVYALHRIHIVMYEAKSIVIIDIIERQFQKMALCFEKSLMGPHDYLIRRTEDEKKRFAKVFEKLMIENANLKGLIMDTRLKATPRLCQQLRETEKRLLALEEVFSQYEIAAGKVLGLKNPFGNPKAGSYMEEMDAIVDKVTDVLAEEVMLLSEISDAAIEQIHTLYQHIMILMTILGIVAVLAGSLLSYYVIQSITGPVGHLVATTRKITSGDFTARARVETHDEIGELACQFNEMVDNLVGARELTSAILHGSGDGMRVIDKDFNILQSNVEMEKLTGIASGESVGQKCYEHFHHEVCHTEMCTLRRVLMGEERIVSEVIKETRDGRKIPVQFVATPLKKGGEIIGVIESFRDISERKQAEEALQKSHDELEQMLQRLKETQAQVLQSEKLASIGQLAAGVAHEINNPTGFISSNLHSLASYEKDISALIAEYRSLISELNKAVATEEGRAAISEKLERIAALEKEIDIEFLLDDTPNLIKECREGTEQIKKIVIDLKDFAHPGEGKLKYADINKCLDSTLNIVWNELKYKATVTKEYGDLPEVQCYPQQLNQVFMNLLVNAAQAIENKGEIRIVTQANDGYVEIKISDTGVGIPKENLSKIFDPFFTTKEEGKGTGLGLNVTYQIVKKHKGTIDVESTVGAGTTFTIRIPVD